MLKFKSAEFSLYFLQLLISYTLLSYSNLNAQVNNLDTNDFINQFSISNPDVYTFEKYKLNTVNQHVGKQDVEVPIYTIKVGKIEYPIKLVYNAGGIKVDQLASDVGLGWSMSKSVITRIINNDNDFDNTGSLSLQSDYNTYTDQEKTNDFKAFVNQKHTGKVGYFLQNEKGQKIENWRRYVDFLPDTYKFYSDKLTSSFFFKDINTPIEINPQGTKITAIPGKLLIPTYKWGLLSSVNGYPNYGYLPNLVTRDFFKIIIQTNDGVKYTFADCDYSVVEQFQADGSVNNFGFQNYNFNGSPAQISAWHISTIEDTKSGKKIEFFYQNTSSNPNNNDSQHRFNFEVSQNSYSYSTVPKYQDEIGCHYYAPLSGSYPKNFILNGSARIDLQKKILKKIIFEDGQVEFNYNHEGVFGAGSQRNDVFNGSYLTQIYLKDNNKNTIKSYNLEYSKFESDYNIGEFNPEGKFNSYRYHRLKLISFNEVGKPKYKFGYIENIKLPPINSFSIDFAGYFNNSPDIKNTSELITLNRSPKLYYYPNQFEKSLLPFHVPGLNSTTIPGYFNREANEYAKAWSLNKIEYPTGGSSEYFYESNDFEIFGKTIKGGGVRISKQLLNDGNGNSREINYSYTKQSGETSGNLTTFPYFGHPIKEFFNIDVNIQPDDFDNMKQFSITSQTMNTNDSINWKLFDKANLNADITNNSFVEYSRSVEKENNKGSKELLFTSSDQVNFNNKYFRAFGDYSADIISTFGLGEIHTCIDKFIIANSGIGSNIFSDNSYKRGKLLEENIYNESNQIISKTKIDYSDILINDSFNFHQGFTKPVRSQNSDKNLKRLMTVGKKYKIAQFLPIKKTVSLYASNGEELKTETKFTYNSNGFPTTIVTTDSKGNTKLNKFYYPTDVSTASSLPGGGLSQDELNGYLTMKGATSNNISEQIQLEDYNNSDKKNTIRKTYKAYNPATGLALPESVKSAKGNEILSVKYSTTAYDSGTGNPTEISQESGTKTVLIWGYKKNKLLAKLDNINLSSIATTIITDLQTLSDLDNDNCKQSTCKEEQLRVALNNLRTSYPDAMITTYTYDPLIGVTSITNPRGETKYFEYDKYNRLKTVKDYLGNILSDNEYNYKN